MEPLLTASASIAGLFIVLLMVKALLPGRLKEKFCAVCLAVSLTWVALLFFYWEGRFNDGMLLTLLMGQSVVGLFYLLQASVPERLKVFQLPALLTLTLVAYSLASSTVSTATLLFALALWAAFLIIFALRNNARVATLFRSIVECCRRW